MGQTSYDTVFDEITDKQREALDLAANGLTSKEIGRRLGISPHSVDKRIDAVRAQLDAMPRNRLVREFRYWSTGCESITGDLPPLTDDPLDPPQGSSQSSDEALYFDDALAFGGAYEWNREPRWLHRGISPSDVNATGRLLLILAMAILIAAAFVLVAASGNVLIDMFT